ncbi:GlsB/YeaQ/YmgE family stress response membrane protein [Microvirga rosea]|uniref:GlsB/YeaQ/YmgE family stress response membrane protein n=1 Tax=Microvirga rosea TaxID=2715425 RepID=UPI001D0A029E|nr:GlsB/YeaQ/YmgE family stress response membrane protein [Microvirga rosea]MCB8821673.1 GlsB/YeaQ/YmgE family stress response membrane protein [Microvirga rosea]
MSIIWTIIIGFVAGVIAKLIMPGRNEPSGFILTTILGIVGAFVATYLGQALGWYRADEGAGFIGAVVGAIIVLFIWGLIAGRSRSTSTY